MKRVLIQRIVERVSTVFAPVALVIAATTLLGWCLTTGDWEQAIQAYSEHPLARVVMAAARRTTDIPAATKRPAQPERGKTIAMALLSRLGAVWRSPRS